MCNIIKTEIRVLPNLSSIQPNDKTRQAQLSTWADLVLNYQRHHNQAVLSLNEKTPLFNNESIHRNLRPEGRLVILEHLERLKNAAPCDLGRQQWEIYWHPLEEWATMIHSWALNNGMTNTVCTLFEMTEGDTSLGQEWHGLDRAVFVKALKVLERQEKCELMGEGDDGGVKFY